VHLQRLDKAVPQPKMFAARILAYLLCFYATVFSAMICNDLGVAFQYTFLYNVDVERF
jgi:hypothetical protein